MQVIRQPTCPIRRFDLILPRVKVGNAAALDMIEDNAKSGSTVGGDKNYDTASSLAVANAAARWSEAKPR